LGCDRSEDIGETVALGTGLRLDRHGQLAAILQGDEEIEGMAVPLAGGVKPYDRRRLLAEVRDLGMRQEKMRGFLFEAALAHDFPRLCTAYDGRSASAAAFPVHIAGRD